MFAAAPASRRGWYSRRSPLTSWLYVNPRAKPLPPMARSRYRCAGPGPAAPALPSSSIVIAGRLPRDDDGRSPALSSAGATRAARWTSASPAPPPLGAAASSLPPLSLSLSSLPVDGAAAPPPLFLPAFFFFFFLAASCSV